MFNSRVMRRTVLGCFASTTVVCETQKNCPNKIGWHQYEANRFIEDRIGHRRIGQIELVTVMDGHGGPQLAEFLKSKIPEIFSENLNSSNAREALRKTFLIADQRWFELVHPVYSLGFTNPIKVGACALAIAIDEASITVASVGDCKCVLALKDGTVVDLNPERNINKISEQERLKQLHPGEEDLVRCKRFDPVREVYSGCYVKGRLQPTKSFGDFHLKDSRVEMDHERQRPFLDPNFPKSFPYIDVDPDISVTARTGKEKFLIAATDGLWDQFSSEEACLIVDSCFNRGLSSEEAARELVEAALMNAAKHKQISLADMKAIPPGSTRRGIHDDISVCVVVL
jgi:pyruvate dehydrogenase phosphatase